MSDITISGEVKQLDGTAWPNARVELRRVGEAVGEMPVVAVADASGAFSVTIWTDETAPFDMSARLPDGSTFQIVVDPEEESVDAKTLRASKTATSQIENATPSVGQPITPFIVVVGKDPAVNGQALLDTYAAAVASTPNGLALAADNRAVVVCPPALYEMPSSIVLASPYVDIVGLTDDVASQVLVPSATATDGAVQGHGDGDGAKFYNLTFRANGDNEITGFTFPSSLANSYFQNCVWVNVDDAYGMETAVEIGSTFDDCVGDNSSFGGLIGGTFSGIATNCTGGTGAFGGNGGSFDGTATNCTGGTGAFGGKGGSFSGIATNCTGGGNAFGGLIGGTFSGIATNCTGGDNSFGGRGTFSGTATNCTGGTNAFGGGGGGGTFNGTATNCTGGDNSFGGRGTFSGTATNCTGGSNAFGGGGGGTFNGTATNCTGDNGSFGGNGGTFSSAGRAAYCRLTSNNFPTPDTGGKIVLCIDGSWTEVNAAP